MGRETGQSQIPGGWWMVWKGQLPLGVGGGGRSTSTGLWRLPTPSWWDWALAPGGGALLPVNSTGLGGGGRWSPLSQVCPPSAAHVRGTARELAMGPLVVLKALKSQLPGAGRGTRSSASSAHGAVGAGFLLCPTPEPCSPFSCSQGRGSA